MLLARRSVFEYPKRQMEMSFRRLATFPPKLCVLGKMEKGLARKMERTLSNTRTKTCFLSEKQYHGRHGSCLASQVVTKVLKAPWEVFPLADGGTEIKLPIS